MLPTQSNKHSHHAANVKEEFVNPRTTACLRRPCSRAPLFPQAAESSQWPATGVLIDLKRSPPSDGRTAEHHDLQDLVSLGIDRVLDCDSTAEKLGASFDAHFSTGEPSSLRSLFPPLTERCTTEGQLQQLVDSFRCFVSRFQVCICGPFLCGCWFFPRPFLESLLFSPFRSLPLVLRFVGSGFLGCSEHTNRFPLPGRTQFQSTSTMGGCGRSVVQ